jgi:hypothetical protein
VNDDCLAKADYFPMVFQLVNMTLDAYRVEIEMRQSNLKLVIDEESRRAYSGF